MVRYTPRRRRVGIPNHILPLTVTEDSIFRNTPYNHGYTSNKKHFMKNVKECRDVIVKKVLEQGWDTRTTHYTHVGPMTPYIVVINYMTCIACLC